MVIDVEDLRRRKRFQHLAHPLAARIKNEQQIDSLFLTARCNDRLFDDIAGMKERKIARNIVVDDDTHPFAEAAQTVHDAQRRTDGVSVGIDMRRDDDVLCRLEQFACFFQ